MGLLDTLLEKTILKSPKTDSVSFSQALAQGKHVLVAPAGSGGMHEAYEFTKAFNQLFPGKKYRILLPKQTDEKTASNGAEGIYITAQQQGAWALMKDPGVATLRQKGVDIFIDLDPKPNALNAFLCRRLSPPLRIALSKPGADTLYNMEYKASGKTAGAQGLLEFLSKFKP